MGVLFSTTGVLLQPDNADKQNAPNIAPRTDSTVLFIYFSFEKREYDPKTRFLNRVRMFKGRGVNRGGGIDFDSARMTVQWRKPMPEERSRAFSLLKAFGLHQGVQGKGAEVLEGLFEVIGSVAQ